MPTLFYFIANTLYWVKLANGKVDVSGELKMTSDGKVVKDNILAISISKHSVIVTIGNKVFKIRNIEAKPDEWEVKEVVSTGDL